VAFHLPHEESVMVTDENFGELLIEGAEEMAAHQRGEGPPVKVVRRLRAIAPDPDADAPPDPASGRRW
jgi:hypothetical protein